MESTMSNTASSNAKHTSTPYAVKKGLHGNPDGVTIWQAKQPGVDGVKGIAKMSLVHDQDEVEATAAFIVRACNAHEQLVEAAVEMIRTGLFQWDHPQKIAADKALRNAVALAIKA
jgi:hypothetical protein